jgi:hypothetical protein
MRRGLPRLAGLVLAFLLVTAGQWKLLTYPGCYWPAHDLRFGLERIAVAERCIREGQWYPRWSGELYGGYGYPLLQFYPPLFTLLGVGLSLLGWTVLGAAKLLVFLALCLGGAFTYLWLRPLTTRAGAFLGAVLYACFPYHVIVLVMRGALAEYLALAFFPLVLVALERLVDRGGAGRLVLAGLAVAGLMLAHNASFLFFLPGALVYVAGRFLLLGRGRDLLRLGPALGLGLGLSAFYWLPAFLEKTHVRIDRLVSAENVNYTKHFVSWQDLWDPGWSFGGLGFLLLAALGLAPLFPGIFRGGRRAGLWLLPVLAAGYVLLSLEPARPVWESITLLQYVGYPWRLFGAAGLFAAATAALLIGGAPGGEAPDHRFQAAVALLAIVWLIGSGPMAQPFRIARFNERVLLSEPAIRESTTSTVVADEYAPRWVQTPPHEALGTVQDPVSDTAAVDVIIEEQRSHRVRFVTSGRESALLRLNMIYFPGWQVRVDGERRPLSYDNPHGLIEVLLSEGTHGVEVLLGPTPVRRVAAILTLLSLLAAIALPALPRLLSLRRKGPDEAGP